MSSVASKPSNVPDEGILLLIMEKMGSTYACTHTHVHARTCTHMRSSLHAHIWQICEWERQVNSNGRTVVAHRHITPKQPPDPLTYMCVCLPTPAPPKCHEKPSPGSSQE